MSRIENAGSNYYPSAAPSPQETSRSLPAQPAIKPSSGWPTAARSTGTASADRPVRGPVKNTREFADFIAKNPTKEQFKAKYPDVTLVMPGQVVFDDGPYEAGSRFEAETDPNGRIIGGDLEGTGHIGARPGDRPATGESIKGPVTDTRQFKNFIATNPTLEQFKAKYPDVTLVMPGQVAPYDPTGASGSRFEAVTDKDGRIIGGDLKDKGYIGASAPDWNGVVSDDPVHGPVKDTREFAEFISNAPTEKDFKDKYPDVTLVMPGQASSGDSKGPGTRFIANTDEDGDIIGGHLEGVGDFGTPSTQKTAQKPVVPPAASKPVDPPSPSKPADPQSPSKPADPQSPSKPADPPSPSKPVDPSATDKPADRPTIDIQEFASLFEEGPVTKEQFKAKYPDIELVMPGETYDHSSKKPGGRFIANTDESGRIIGGRLEDVGSIILEGRSGVRGPVSDFSEFEKFLRDKPTEKQFRKKYPDVTLVKHGQEQSGDAKGFGERFVALTNKGGEIIGGRLEGDKYFGVWPPAPGPVINISEFTEFMTTQPSEKEFKARYPDVTFVVSGQNTTGDSKGPGTRFVAYMDEKGKITGGHLEGKGNFGTRPVITPVHGPVNDIQKFGEFGRFLDTHPTPEQFKARYPDVTLVTPGQEADGDSVEKGSRFVANFHKSGRIDGGTLVGWQPLLIGEPNGYWPADRHFVW